MAKFKKLPKKPKASASVATMENYLRRVADVKKFNDNIKREKTKKEALKRKIAGIRPDSVK